MAKRSDKESTPAAPNGPPCPKCGQHKGWNGPTYQRGVKTVVTRPVSPTKFQSQEFETTESLVWTCDVCGYKRHEPCKDDV